MPVSVSMENDLGTCVRIVIVCCSSRLRERARVSVSVKATVLWPVERDSEEQALAALNQR
jgi:hypothetical protein